MLMSSWSNDAPGVIPMPFVLTKNKDFGAEYLRSILQYYPDSGLWIWRNSPKPHLNGLLAGSLNNQGYYEIGINKKQYKVANLAWLYMTGEWPKGTVDHKDRNRSNDKWNNLDDVIGRRQIANRKSFSNSGVKGVSLRTIQQGKYQYWTASISVEGKLIHLGDFKTKEEAINARRLGEIEYFGMEEDT